MKQISTSLTLKLREDSVVERDYIIFVGETTKHYIWFNLYDDCYKDGNFIGTFIMKRIELTYNDSNLEFKNKEFDAYKEYKVDDGTWESIHYGTFIVQSVEESDTKEEIKVTAYDYALKFANTYKTDLDYASGKITLFQVLQEVCQKVGVTLENTSIDNGNFIVDSNQFIEGTLFGNVITAIAQISCNFAKITPENKLKLLFKNESNVIIETKDYEEFEDKRDTLPYTAVSLGVSNVEGENVTIIAPGVDPDDAKYLTINDNPFAYTQEKRTQLIQAIFNKINGFGYSSFVLKNCLYPQLECGDLIKIKNKEGQLVDSIVLRPTFEEVVLNFEAPSTITSSVSYVQPVDAIELAKRTELIVDKQNQTITGIIANVEDVTEKTTEIEASVDGLNVTVSNLTDQSQQIADLNVKYNEIQAQIESIQDLTVQASVIDEPAFLDKVAESELIYLQIRPSSQNISLLYPRNNLYPSNDLFSTTRDVYFYSYFLTADITVDTSKTYYTKTGSNYDVVESPTGNPSNNGYYEKKEILYTLPEDLLYFDSNVYDEFVLDFDSQKMWVTKRVGRNADGTTYALDNEVANNYTYVPVILSEGSWYVKLYSFNKYYINVRALTNNLYTEQYATQVQLKTAITQTEEYIDLEASKKVGNDEVISKINVSPETIKITSDKLDVDAIATFTNSKLSETGSTVINGSNITTGTINGSLVNVTNINASNITGGTINGNNVNVTNLNASNITGGTLSASKISGGTISASNISLKNATLSPSSSRIGGWYLGTSSLYSTSANVDSYLYSNGNVLFGGNYGMIKFDTNPVRITTANQLLLSDSYSAGSMASSGDTISLRAYSGTIHINSNYGVYANSTLLSSGSARAMKENIEELSQEEIDEVYEEIKNLKSYKYDYKKQYAGGQKDNYGFIIEDFENNTLGKILHVNKGIDDDKTKYYSHNDLTQINTILIQKLIKKIEKLEQENINLRKEIENGKNNI